MKNYAKLLPKGETFCRKHGEVLPTSDFVPSSLTKDRQRGVCKTCWAEYMAGRRKGELPLTQVSPSLLSGDICAMHRVMTAMAKAVTALAKHTDSETRALAAPLVPDLENLSFTLASMRKSVPDLLDPDKDLQVTDPLALQLEPLPGGSGGSISGPEPEIRTNVGSDAVRELALEAARKMSLDCAGVRSPEDQKNMDEFAAFLKDTKGRSITEVTTDIESNLRSTSPVEAMMANHIAALDFTADDMRQLAQLTGEPIENLLTDEQTRKLTDEGHLAPVQQYSVPLSDLPDNATEDDYARAQMLAEDHAESLHADQVTVGPLGADQITDGPVFVHLPIPQTEFMLGNNKSVQDLDPDKQDF